MEWSIQAVGYMEQWSSIAISSRIICGGVLKIKELSEIFNAYTYTNANTNMN